MFLFAMGFVQKSFAQTQDCPLSCNDLVQVSLDNECIATITPEMVIEGENDNAQCPYKIYKITKANGQIVGGGQVDGTWVINGNAAGLYRSDIDCEVGFNPSINNVCWGKIIIEDKISSNTEMS